jgi:glycogen operon protein
MHADVHRFLTLLIARRRLRDVEHERQRVSLNKLLRQATITWHGVKLNQPDWSVHSHSVAFSAELPKENVILHMILNAYWEPLDFHLPPVGNGEKDPWRRWIDTALESPEDILPWQTAPPVPGLYYRAESRSVVVLFASK